MKLTDEALDLLCAAFLVKAGRPDEYNLLYVKRQGEFAAAFHKSTGIALSDDEAAALLDKLIDIGIFSKADDRFTKGFIHVIGNPREKLDVLAKRSGSPYFFAEKIGQEWLDEALASSEFLNELSDPSLELVSAIAPASDRLVRLDHNSRELSGAIEQIESAEEAIRGSNSVDPETTSWIRDHLKAGLSLLQGKKIVKSAISALIIKPLLAAYESITDEPVKHAIRAAIQAVKQLFGL